MLKVMFRKQTLRPSSWAVKRALERNTYGRAKKDVEEREASYRPTAGLGKLHEGLWS